jgi:hypothetical protein
MDQQQKHRLHISKQHLMMSMSQQKEAAAAACLRLACLLPLVRCQYLAEQQLAVPAAAAAHMRCCLKSK